MSSHKERLLYLAGRAKLERPIGRLSKATDGSLISETPRLFIALALLTAVYEYSASGNAIPALSGLGYEDALKLADSINAADAITERSIVLHSYRLVAQAIEVS